MTAAEREELLEVLAEENPDALTADGFDEAFIGICRRFSLPPLAAYSYEKCLEVIMQDGCAHGDAVEHLELNVLGSWVGEGTPVFIKMEVS